MGKRDKGKREPSPKYLERHKKGLAVALFVVAVIILAVYNSGKPDLIVPYGPGGAGDDYVGDTIIQTPLFYTPTWNSCLEDYRPSYDLPCDKQKQIFGQLPKVPADHLSVTRLVWNGFFRGDGITDLRLLSQKYWVQPEFFPGWRGQDTIRGMLSDDGTYWTPRGYGAYPSIRGYNIPLSRVGTPIETLDLLRTAFNTSHYQGLGLFVYFPDCALAINRSVIFCQDPNVVSKMFRVTFKTNSHQMYLDLKASYDFEDTVPPGGIFVVLPPTRASFTSDWVVPIQLLIEATGSVPPGKYVFSIGMVDPAPFVTERYYLTYGESFVKSGSWLTPPLFQYILQVG